ncbi:3-methylfumaryl-CoA hydratase [Duganella sp. CF402]|uniref:FAS1-like dehydratase domain-containing protein n=1 Tax=unclassified Duganella TaxID=2636909 RepID=UPI0008D1390F|nr:MULTISPECIES: MaoC family dehydratase N-terminal domain-containing protein [unclassified Duganella]RZT08230.1 3-methylfumaryl-CoA hydratase [Duganella sp. BK701]SEM01386.1 3-methylfumaryl-CoA hydratase [Duganella sp. CF402]
MNLHALQDWTGRVEEREDVVTAAPLALLAATLDLPPQPLQTVPPLWHWLYFLPTASLAEAGVDGHPQRGGFLPPVPLPRRMWAGSRVQFRQPLNVGETIRRRSEITGVTHKEGKSGPLVFVAIRQTIANARGVALVEDQTVVYRDAAPSAAAAAPVRGQPIPYPAQFHRKVLPGPVLLFRYSALTFNSHRIHYDHPYVVQEEGYPDLVVHGPLCATLLVEEVRRQYPDRRIAAFEFKALSPLFANAEFGIGGCLDGSTVHVWTETPDGCLGMLAKAELA